MRKSFLIISSALAAAFAATGCGASDPATITISHRIVRSSGMFTEGFRTHLVLTTADGLQLLDVEPSSKNKVERTLPAGKYVVASYIVDGFGGDCSGRACKLLPCSLPISVSRGERVNVLVTTRTDGICRITKI